MKIVEWNCQGAFRKKADPVLLLSPDILVIPECEHPDKLKFDKLTPRPTDFFWHGDSTNKGIGVFSYSEYRLELLKEFDPKFRYVIPLKVSSKSHSFLLFAIWAMDNKENPQARYIAQIWQALQYYSRLLSQSIVIVGDFNSNQIWDESDRIANHTDVVEFLNKHGIQSMYHKKNNVPHGQERDFTFHMYRKAEKPYHIDYCFASDHFFDKSFDIQIGRPPEWLTHSDHVPLIIQSSGPNTHLDYTSSLHAHIEYATEQLSSRTSKSFAKSIDRIKKKALLFDETFDQTAKLEAINALDRIVEIDRQVIHLIRQGF